MRNEVFVSRYLISSAIAVVAIVAPALAKGDQPLQQVRLIFDTDMGNDVDDALALAMIHALESRNECELLAVTVTKGQPLAAAFVDAVNRFYGRGDIPVGLARNAPTPEVGKFLSLVAPTPDGGPAAFPHKFTDLSSIPDATTVLREVLSQQPDHSVVVVQVGFSTNLARLLDSESDGVSELSGIELVQQKVKLLQIMAGRFHPSAEEDPSFVEYNVANDVPSVRTLLEKWPTPIEFSGFEVGRAIEYPAVSIREDYRYVERHPIAEAYELYAPPPHNRPTWDLTSVLQAVRPGREYFGRSPNGRVTIDSRGRTIFTPDPNGKHRYLEVSPEQAVRVRETFVCLASEPPRNLRTE